MTGQSGQEGENQPTGARAILRVPEVLREIAATPGGLSLANLARRLDIPKASLFRILRTLESGGYLVEQQGVFRVGGVGLELARIIGLHAPAQAFPACARPVMEWLADETGETVLLGALDEVSMDVAYLDVLDSPLAIRFTVPVGDRRPLYCAASGKAVLAFLPDEQRQAYLDTTRFQAFTPNTCDRASLAEDIAAIRASGIAFDQGGRVEEASGIACPVFNSQERVFAALSVAGPAARIARQKDRFGQLLLRAGERLSRGMGSRAPYPPAGKGEDAL